MQETLDMDICIDLISVTTTHTKTYGHRVHGDNTAPSSKTKEVIETVPGAYNLCFCHLLGILKLA